MQHISRIIHGNNQNTLFSVKTLNSTSANLLRRRRRKDSSCNGSSQKPLSDITGKGRFVARTTTADDGDIGFVVGFGTAEDDFVLFVKGERRVGDGQGAEGLDDQGEGVGEEVFCYSISSPFF
jgi:hypothetical protein